jgi:hypothetical protein
MFNLMKPGHVLRFGTCPSTIVSPQGVVAHHENDNTLATPWPATSNLGLVQCVSHPSGNLGAIAANVATHLRTTAGSKARTASYSAPGQLLTSSNRPIGQDTCDFVGYVDGQSNFIQSTRTVFSKDFSGCLMVVYTVNGQRHVAHAAASAVPAMDCKQGFLTTIQGQHAILIGWFRPFVSALDSARKANAFGVVGQYVGNNINYLTTFGVITAAGLAYSVDAFKPTAAHGNDWVVTYVGAQILSQSWVAP